MSKISMRAALLGGASFAVMVASPLWAQAANQQMETVVVTGIRGSLENATVIKRNADTFVDSITSSDVAALPDVSVAEALSRIPGVTMTRYSYGGASPDFPAAEGSGNLIRGLAFTRSEFNGRDEFTANGGRALDWSSIPPELVGGVDVYKNSSAEIIEGGIGGTINLRTLEPFDRQGLYAAVTGDMTFADLRHAWSPSASAIISNRWETGVGEFGLMASYSTSTLKSKINDWQQGAPVPRTLATIGGATGTTELKGTDKFIGVPASGIVGAQEVFQMRIPVINRNRDSYYLAAQWQNENSIATFKYVRVHNSSATVEHTVEHLPDESSGPNTTITNMVATPLDASVALCNAGGSNNGNQDDCNNMVHIGAGMMVKGNLTSAGDSWWGPMGFSTNTLGRGTTDKSLTEDYSLNFKTQVGDRLHLNVDGQYTTATRRFRELWAVGQSFWDVYEEATLANPKLRFTPNPAGNGPAVTADGMNHNHHFAPHNTTNTADPYGVDWWAYQDGYQDGTGELEAVRADAVYDIKSDWLKDVKVGARYAVRSQNNAETGRWWFVAPAFNWTANTGASFFGNMQQVNGKNIWETVNFKSFYGGNLLQGSNTSFVYLSQSILLNPVLFNRILGGSTGDKSDVDPNLVGNMYTVRNENDPYEPENKSSITERTTDFYAQLDFAHPMGGDMALEGNIGIRWAQTGLSSHGFRAFTTWDQPHVCTAADMWDPVTNPHNGWTVWGCGHSSPRQFLPQTAAFLDGTSPAQTLKKVDHHYLPSLNVKWKLNDEMLIRFAVSDAITRPNVQDMRAGQTIGAGTITTPWPDITDHTDPLWGVNNGSKNIALNSINVGGGNPFLKPTTARMVDVSYEWYFDGGSFSAAGFYKRLHNIIEYGTMTLGHATLDGVTVPVIYTGNVNGMPATVKGVELAYQQWYDFLPGFLSHLGSQANFTYIDAEQDGPRPGCTTGAGTPCRFNVKDLYGQSKYIMNLIAMYQDDKLEVRLAYDWRSKYLVTLGDYMTGNPTWNKPAGFMDGSIKYNVTEGLQARVSFENMLNTKNEAKALLNTHNQYIDRYGVLNDRRVTMGVRYLF